MGHDLVGLGEVMLRLAAPPPLRLDQAVSLDVQIGGSEANVLAAVARLGLRTALISALPADHAWGDRTVRELMGHGVDCAGVLRRPGSRMGLYFLEYGQPPRPVRVLYDRKDSAATVFELTGAPEKILDRLRQLAPAATIALTLGEKGSAVLAGGAIMRPSRLYSVSPVDRIGAGDAYAAGYLWAMLNESAPQRAVDAATALAALKCSIWGDVPLVTRVELEELLASDSTEIRR